MSGKIFCIYYTCMSSDKTQISFSISYVIRCIQSFMNFGVWVLVLTCGHVAWVWGRQGRGDVLKWSTCINIQHIDRYCIKGLWCSISYLCSLLYSGDWGNLLLWLLDKSVYMARGEGGGWSRGEGVRGWVSCNPPLWIFQNIKKI